LGGGFFFRGCECANVEGTFMGKRDHFLPQHYLRQFRFGETDQIAITTMDPCKYVGLGSISGQCQEDSFYEKDAALNQILWQSENDLAPVLTRISTKADFNFPERFALNFFAALLHLRTKSAIEQAKVFPRRIAYEVIRHGIEKGELPEPKEGWREDMMDFGGVPGTIIKEGVIPCWMEMQTLECKLLRANSDDFFITSDHPAVILNQFCVGADSVRSFVGFSLSGFQLLLPISPRLCAFFFDPKVYKVGRRRRRALDISSNDVEIVNSLQIQTADHCLYFHDPDMANDVEELIGKYAGFRTPIKDSLQTYPGRSEKEQILHHKSRSVVLPVDWTFCRLRRHIASRPGDRRDPAWSYAVEQLSDDLHKNPGGQGLFERLKRLGFYDGPVD
jgi:hypothetical protein